MCHCFSPRHGETASSPVGDLHPFTGSTPTVKAVAASSAFLGETIVLPFGQQGIAEHVAKALEEQRSDKFTKAGEQGKLGGFLEGMMKVR